VDARGQGGLLDAALSPDFVSDRTIFWSYAEPREGGNGTAVARGVLSPDRRRVEQVRVIFRAVPTYNGTAHFGSRLAFSPDGTVPDDNPFVGQAGARPEIWTLGHRNIQAAAFDTSGQLWTVEHGTQGGDELNLIQKGKNYGWPIVGALREKRLVRLVLENNRVTGEEHLLMDRGQRIRDVRQGPDGALYLVTDEQAGELWRVAPRG
jgi:glucose/arabinose dehydrogenase